MVNPASGPRRIVFRANRDTLTLIAAASAATFALAYAVHDHPPASAPVVADAGIAPQRDWAGNLAEVSSGPTGSITAEPLTSASLVVPKSALALPTASPTRAKPRACDGATGCGVKGSAATGHAGSGRTELSSRQAAPERSLINRLNPLNHLPGMSTLGRPFAYAGDTISGWIRRF